MKRSLWSLVITAVLAGGAPIRAVGQSFFATFKQLGDHSRQTMAAVEGGELLVAGSALNTLRNGAIQPDIQVSRYDFCGKRIWSSVFPQDSGHFNLKSVEVLPGNRFVLYGSYYIDLKELIFIGIGDVSSGKNLVLRFFDPGTVDHFTYNLVVRGNRIFVYGLLLGFNTQKQGFLQMFDLNLNPVWGKTITPFESTGRAVFTREGGIVAWSGNRVFRLDDQGNILWYKHLSSPGSLSILSGPFLVGDQYFFEVYGNNIAYLCGISPDGEVVRMTPGLEKPDIPWGFSGENLKQGLLTVVGVKNEGQEWVLTCDELDVSALRWVGHKAYRPGTFAFAPFSSVEVVEQNYRTALLANFPDFYPDTTNGQGVLLRGKIADPPCVEIMDVQLVQHSPQTPQFLPAPYRTGNLNLLPVAEKKIAAKPSNPVLMHGCTPPLPSIPTFVDTLIACKEQWKVVLPDSTFYWYDGFQGSERYLSEPGAYLAKKASCSQPYTISFNLSVKECGCAVYLPNAYSPNGDGVNDVFSVFPSCTLQKGSLRAFDRWGNLVYASSDWQSGWDGLREGHPLPSGQYVILFEGTWAEPDGAMRSERYYQDVLLVR